MSDFNKQGQGVKQPKQDGGIGAALDKARSGSSGINNYIKSRSQKDNNDPVNDGNVPIEGQPQSKEEKQQAKDDKVDEQANAVKDKVADELAKKGGIKGKAAGFVLKKVKIKGLNKKKRKLLVMVGISVGVSLLGTIVLIALFLSPILAFGNLVEDFKVLVEKSGNLLSFKGWGTDEHIFWETLNDQYKYYDSLKYADSYLDIPLLAATIHYDTYVDTTYYDEENKDTINNEDNYNNFVVDKENVSSFYTWAYNELGNFETLYLSKRGLSGALVSERFRGECVKAETNLWEALFSVVKSILSDTKYDFQRILGKFWATLQDTVQGVNIAEVLNTYMSKVERYGGAPSVESYLQKIKADYMNIGYDIGNIITLEPPELKCGQIITESCNPKSESGCYKCGEGYCKDYKTKPQYSTRPELWNDYDKYDNYLRTYFLPTWHIDCEKCPYKNLSEEEKKVEIERMIKDIYALKKTYLDLLNIKDLDQQFGNGSYVSSICGVETTITWPATKQCAAHVYGRASSFLQSDPVAWSKFQQIFGNAEDYYYRNLQLGSEGFLVDQTPSAGSLALWTGGNPAYHCPRWGDMACGHILFIESVSADGTLTVSECSGGKWCKMNTYSAATLPTYYNNLSFKGYLHLVGDC